jgi:hypothetical protein
MKAVFLQRRPLTHGLAAGLLLAAFGGLALCADDEIKICVVAILANDREVSVDQKISCIAKEVQKKHSSLTCFKVATTNCKGLAVGTKENFKLVDKETASVTVEQGPDKVGRVKLTVKVPTVGDITYLTACGKCFPFVTDYQTKDHDQLIIAVMVKPCKGEKKK